MLDPEIRARLSNSAAEYERLADAAGVENIAVAVDARQGARDIRAVLLAAETDAAPGQLSYGQLRAAAVQNERLLIFLILQAGGELRLQPATTEEHGADVLEGRYRLAPLAVQDSPDFVIGIAKVGKPS